MNIDKNRSENALRKVSLGRKKLSLLRQRCRRPTRRYRYSLIVSFKLRGIHPAAYLKDVLLRIDSTLATHIVSLTLARWYTSPSLSAPSRFSFREQILEKYK